MVFLRMSFPCFHRGRLCGSRNPILSVIPAEAGIQGYLDVISLVSRLRENDKNGEESEALHLRVHKKK